MAVEQDHATNRPTDPVSSRRLPKKNSVEQRRSIVSQAHRVHALITMSVVLGVATGCASIGEEVIYPERIGALNTLPSSDVAENAITIEMSASAERVWDSLLTVLAQHAFITSIDTSDPHARELAYVDYTMVMLDEKLVHVALPFNVTVQQLNAETSSIRVFARWDLVASQTYRSKEPERYEDLSASMLGEAYMLVARVDAQAATLTRWHWLNN